MAVEVIKCSVGVLVHIRTHQEPVSVYCKHVNYTTKRDRAFIFHMCISCGKTFLSIPKFFTWWPWPWLLTYFWKNLTLAITFDPKQMGLSYFTCVFLVARPFFWKQNFLPRDLHLDFWTTLNRKVRALIYIYLFPVTRPFCWYQYFWPSGLDLDFWKNLNWLSHGVLVPLGQTPI